MEPDPIYETETEKWQPTQADIDNYYRKRGWPQFDDFSFAHMTTKEREVMQAAITAAVSFSEESREKPGRAFILLASEKGNDNLRTGYGCGKTMLARCIFYQHAGVYYSPGAGPESLGAAPQGQFYEARELMALFDESNYDPGYTFKKFKPIIVIDDIGREGSLRWEKRDPDAQLYEKQSRYYNVIDHCYRVGISIVITSNLGSRELAAFLGGASWSRLLHMAPAAYRINLTGLPDMRPQLSAKEWF